MLQRCLLALLLAAYNIGRAHLHDAQTLARQQGLKPYLWRDRDRRSCYRAVTSFPSGSRSDGRHR
jgi:membrane-bound lytic murein transglycosylase MltF